MHCEYLDYSSKVCLNLDGVHISSQPAYFSAKCHGIFGLYDAGSL